MTWLPSRDPAFDLLFLFTDSIHFPELYNGEVTVSEDTELIPYQQHLVPESSELLPHSYELPPENVDFLPYSEQNQEHEELHFAADQLHHELLFAAEPQLELVPNAQVQDTDAKELHSGEYLLYPMEDEDYEQSFLDFGDLDANFVDVHPAEGEPQFLDLSGLDNSEYLSHHPLQPDEPDLEYYGLEPPDYHEEVQRDTTYDDLSDDDLIDTLRQLLDAKLLEVLYNQRLFKLLNLLQNIRQI